MDRAAATPRWARSNPPLEGGSSARHIVPGRKYTVSCVRACYPDGLRIRWWPIAGTFHEDNETVGFPHYHYHIDWRFVAPKLRRDIAHAIGEGEDRMANAIITASHIRALGQQGHHNSGQNGAIPLEPTTPTRSWYRRLKRAAYIAQPVRWSAIGTRHWHRRMEDAVRGCAMHMAEDGSRTCPHRGTDLTSVEPDQNGIIECPAHGLHWNARTGDLVPRPEFKARTPTERFRALLGS